jgi:endonuclease/exonuclease/phosphatase family metal-dependent hydrolase
MRGELSAPAAAPQLPSPPHLILGDFNCFCRSDYNRGEWERIERIRREHAWEAARDTLWKLIVEQEQYSDLWKQCNQKRSSSAAAANGAEEDDTPAAAAAGAPPRPVKFTAHVNDPTYRIDYAFASPNFSEAGCRVLACWVETNVRVSDHFPLCVDLLVEAIVDRTRASVS